MIEAEKLIQRMAEASGRISATSQHPVALSWVKLEFSQSFPSRLDF